MAHERFTDTGPLALLPLTDNRLSLVWSCRPQECDHLLHCDEATFLDMLYQRFGHSLGLFEAVGKRAAYPLRLLYSPDIARHRTLIMGNAAHTIHPIAGQGFNLGLRDIRDWVELLQQRQVADVGDFALLHHYARHRRRDHQRVIALTDGLTRLFSNNNRLVALGRNTGLWLMNQCQSLQWPLALQAMGLLAEPIDATS